MDPGFLALYKRGNYFKPKLDSLDQRKREERERFAMAAIAFCLKYNHAFRSVFLHVVCGIEKTCRFDDLKIDVEQKPWGDLLLKTKDGIYIIEGKIDAPLQPWQDFGADAFRADGGYGAAIDTAFNNDARRRYYIVLGYSERTLKQPKGKLILCSQKYWEDLERACPQSQSMPFDLADCLAELGVEAFYLRKTKKMKIKNSLEEAGMACEVIAGTFKSLGIKEHKISVTGSYSDRKHWSFGSDLPFP